MKWKFRGMHIFAVAYFGSVPIGYLARGGNMSGGEPIFQILIDYYGK